MKEKKRFPIKIVKTTHKDLSPPNSSGGSNKVFGAVDNILRMSFAEKIHAIKMSKLREEPKENHKGIAKVILKKNAIAKSHRPTSLFNKTTCPIVGGRRFGELYISYDLKALDKLSDKILNNKSKTVEANISTLENIEPYSQEDILGDIPLDSLYSNINNKSELKIKLFSHHSNSVDTCLIVEFLELIHKLGLSEPDEIFYTPEMKVYKLSNIKPQHITPLLNFSGIQELGFFPIFQTPNTSCVKTDFSEKTFPPPTPNTKYPIVGLIDSGVDPNNISLANWCHARYNYLPIGEEDYSHGTFIAGLLTHPDKLNDSRFPATSTKYVDVAVMPKNSKIAEYQLLQVIEDIVPKHPEVKYWNLSINLYGREVVDHSFSDFATSLDYLQEKYKVTFVISAGNHDIPRSWPPSGELKEEDRILPPAESVRGIAVGSIAHLANADSKVQIDHPSPFSRRGPGTAYIPKPDLSHYGGNCKEDFDFTQTGIRSFGVNNDIIESIGTSYSTPLVANVMANIHSSIQNNVSPCLIRALAIHSAVIGNADINPQELKYYGFGTPSESNISLSCTPWEATLVFEPELIEGLIFNKHPFPIPPSLKTSDGKVRGEFIITLAYDTPFDRTAGAEYCRVNIDASLGSCNLDADDQVIDHKIHIHPQPKLNEYKMLYEDYQIKYGLKWSPTKVYRRLIKNGINANYWNLKLRLLTRSNYKLLKPLKVSLVLTLRDPHKKANIYDEVMVNMNKNGWITEELRIRSQQQIKV